MSLGGGYYCLKQEKGCVRWVERYFKDCLCNFRDELSFTFGFMSLIFWGVAEIPQIITNFRTKSSHGVSLAFLLTWIAGDVFNLIGCLLEPATLPTQFYTALVRNYFGPTQLPFGPLYTTSTVLLVLQSLYYDYVRRWCLSKRTKNQLTRQVEEGEKKPLRRKSHDEAIPIPSKSNPTAFYYTSARSLAGSGTPPFRTYMRVVAKSGPSALGIDTDSSSDDENDQTHPPTSFKQSSVSQPRPIPRSVAGYGTFLAASANFPRGISKGFATRRLLQERSMEHSTMGQWLGWLMAAIYMGGRIPQIWLNIKRGSVEGLNPLMFIFALMANLTYVASILVRTTEWGSIKANMPWLLDAVVCVFLDFFIILQYVYYRYFRKKRGSRTDTDNFYGGTYMESTKSFGT